MGFSIYWFRLGWAWFSGTLPIRQWQREAKRAPFPQFAFDFDLSTLHFY